MSRLLHTPVLAPLAVHAHLVLIIIDIFIIIESFLYNVHMHCAHMWFEPVEHARERIQHVWRSRARVVFVSLSICECLF